MMTAFDMIPHYAYAFIGCWSFFLFIGMVCLFCLGLSKVRRKKVISFHVRSILLLSGVVFIYSMLQCIQEAHSEKLDSILVINTVRWFSKLPVILIVVVCVCLTAIEIVLMVNDIKWHKTHITDNSIKEAVDSLPAGVCVYNDRGRVILKNEIMDKLCIDMTGEIILNGINFVKSIEEYHSRTSMGEKSVNILPDGKVFIFSREEIEISNGKLTILTAFDMTEEYEKTQILFQKRKAMQELNAQLVAYNRDIVSIITSQEVLNAKVKIHDELGAGLLSIKHYLINGGRNEEKKTIIEKLNQNMEFLRRERAENKQDEYVLMFSTANALDVSIPVKGELPQDEPNKHIIATAIHECFTNTVRHAKGDLLNINVIENDSRDNYYDEKNQYLTVIFTNNGEQPKENIIERGGLSSLRSLVEGAGGTMRIDISNGFELRISLPKGECFNGV